MVEHMERRLKEDLGVRVNVELVDEGTLTEFTNFGREGQGAPPPRSATQNNDRRRASGTV